MSVTLKQTTPLQDIDSKKELVKRMYCKGATDDELELFIHVCKKTGLDPFMKQVYPVKRWSSVDKREVMSIQTSIDGFRLIGERTGRYSPGREPSFVYDKDGKLVSATSYVKKMTADGTWHEIAATAFFEEYAQRKKEGGLTSFWEKMPHVMLAKCAESLALRKAFPAELSGIYTVDEMAQASDGEVVEKEMLTEEQCATIDSLLIAIEDEEYVEKLQSYLKVSSLYDVNQEQYKKLITSLEKKVKEKRSA